MYPAERHKWLIDTARETGRVSVAEASTALGVVPETIRRDLDQLCNQKMLRRVHGGAIPIEFDLLGDQPLATRDSSAVTQKEQIAGRHYPIYLVTRGRSSSTPDRQPVG